MDSHEKDKSWDFDRSAERYDANVMSDSRYYHARYDEVLDTVAETANLVPGERVLDIGTGTGNLAVRCLARGAQVVGVDPSESMLAKARQKVGAIAEAEFCHCAEPFLSLPIPDASFDAVVSTYAYHHIPHRLKAKSVREMLRVLKPNGRWVLGDLAFEDEAAEARALRELTWLEEEYFTRIDNLREVFAEFGMRLHTRQFTPVTWVLWTCKARVDG